MGNFSNWIRLITILYIFLHETQCENDNLNFSLKDHEITKIHKLRPQINIEIDGIAGGKCFTIRDFKIELIKDVYESFQRGNSEVLHIANFKNITNLMEKTYTISEDYAGAISCFVLDYFSEKDVPYVYIIMDEIHVDEYCGRFIDIYIDFTGIKDHDLRMDNSVKVLTFLKFKLQYGKQRNALERCCSKNNREEHTRNKREKFDGNRKYNHLSGTDENVLNNFENSDTNPHNERNPGYNGEKQYLFTSVQKCFNEVCKYFVNVSDMLLFGYNSNLKYPRESEDEQPEKAKDYDTLQCNLVVVIDAAVLEELDVVEHVIIQVMLLDKISCNIYLSKGGKPYLPTLAIRNKAAHVDEVCIPFSEVESIRNIARKCRPFKCFHEIFSSLCGSTILDGREMINCGSEQFGRRVPRCKRPKIAFDKQLLKKLKEQKQQFLIHRTNCVILHGCYLDHVYNIIKNKKFCFGCNKICKSLCEAYPVCCPKHVQISDGFASPDYNTSLADLSMCRDTKREKDLCAIFNLKRCTCDTYPGKICVYCCMDEGKCNSAAELGRQKFIRMECRGGKCMDRKSVEQNVRSNSHVMATIYAEIIFTVSYIMRLYRFVFGDMPDSKNFIMILV